MTETKSQAIAADVAALLRARNPLLWIVTREEARVEGYLFEAATAARYKTWTWDIAQGAIECGGPGRLDDSTDPGAMLNAIATLATAEKSERRLWVLRDFPVWIAGQQNAVTLRQVRNLARMLPGIGTNNAQAMVVLSPSGDVPAELANHATVIEWPLPDRAEIASSLDELTAQYKIDLNGQREAAIDAAVGLSGEEAQACYARSLVQLKTIDPKIVAKEKRRVIARERVLEWFDPLPGGLDAVGGLENLKAWLKARQTAYSKEAREYGLPMPKGALLGGIPGCGKSLSAKAIATAWGVPLLRMDVGALRSKFVGDSEANIRKAFSVISAIGRCVLWIDEIEKALQGATSGSSDGGVSADALGAILSWMQERQGEAFVIATANDVDSLPPELLRKGRFDEVWWIDLPTAAERAEILTAALRAHNRSGDGKNFSEIIAVSEGFTGSEVAALVPDALYRAFADGAREIKESDLLEAARGVVPLSKTAEEKIAKLRAWGKAKARPASKTVEKSAAAPSGGRNLDI